MKLLDVGNVEDRNLIEMTKIRGIEGRKVIFLQKSAADFT